MADFLFTIAALSCLMLTPDVTPMALGSKRHYVIIRPPSRGEREASIEVVLIVIAVASMLALWTGLI